MYTYYILVRSVQGFIDLYVLYGHLWSIIYNVHLLPYLKLLRYLKLLSILILLIAYCCSHSRCIFFISMECLVLYFNTLQPFSSYKTVKKVQKINVTKSHYQKQQTWISSFFKWKKCMYTNLSIKDSVINIT